MYSVAVNVVFYSSLYGALCRKPNHVESSKSIRQTQKDFLLDDNKNCDTLQRLQSGEKYLRLKLKSQFRFERYIITERAKAHHLQPLQLRAPPFPKMVSCFMSKQRVVHKYHARRASMKPPPTVPLIFRQAMANQLDPLEPTIDTISNTKYESENCPCAYPKIFFTSVSGVFSRFSETCKIIIFLHLKHHALVSSGKTDVLLVSLRPVSDGS